MRDNYFYKSLFFTLLSLVILVSISVIFIVITGIIGFLLVFLLVIALLVYFYGGFKKCIFINKGHDE